MDCAGLITSYFLLPGSPYREALSQALLQLQDRTILEMLKNKWWTQERGGGQCKSRKVRKSTIFWEETMRKSSAQKGFHPTVGAQTQEHRRYFLHFIRRTSSRFYHWRGWVCVQAATRSCAGERKRSEGNIVCESLFSAFSHHCAHSSFALGSFV